MKLAKLFGASALFASMIAAAQAGLQQGNQSTLRPCAPAQ